MSRGLFSVGLSRRPTSSHLVGGSGSFRPPDPSSKPCKYSENKVSSSNDWIPHSMGFEMISGSLEKRPLTSEGEAGALSSLDSLKVGSLSVSSGTRGASDSKLGEPGFGEPSGLASSGNESHIGWESEAFRSGDCRFLITLICLSSPSCLSRFRPVALESQAINFMLSLSSGWHWFLSRTNRKKCLSLK
jgi:hypothetical protein